MKTFLFFLLCNVIYHHGQEIFRTAVLSPSRCNVCLGDKIMPNLECLLHIAFCLCSPLIYNSQSFALRHVWCWRVCRTQEIIYLSFVFNIWIPFHVCTYSLRFLRVKVPLLNIYEKQKRDTKVVSFKLYYNAFDIQIVRAKVCHHGNTLRTTNVKCLNLD